MQVSARLLPGLCRGHVFEAAIRLGHILRTNQVEFWAEAQMRGRTPEKLIHRKR